MVNSPQKKVARNCEFKKFNGKAFQKASLGLIYQSKTEIRNVLPLEPLAQRKH